MKCGKTHGMTETKEYRSWCSMKARCLNPKNPAFDRYGGRGILMDPNWEASFETFFRDVGPAPTKRHSIDRIDNNVGYVKGNCRWSTAREQARNRASNVHLTAFGETKLLCEWSEDPRCVVGFQQLRERVVYCRWEHEYAITTPSLKIGGKADPSKKLPSGKTKYFRIKRVRVQKQPDGTYRCFKK